eukprot:1274021-Amphidinium_carterae.1
MVIVLVTAPQQNNIKNVTDVAHNNETQKCTLLENRFENEWTVTLPCAKDVFRHSYWFPEQLKIRQIHQIRSTT